VRLTQFSDYALRTLLYLGAYPERLVSVGEVARSYRISYNHLVKVAGTLVDLRLVEAVRGRGGGLRLARPPGEISVGWVVRRTEADFHLVECFDAEHDTCPITPACALKNVLQEAQKGFLATLDRYSLADLLATPEHTKRLVQLWSNVGVEGGGVSAQSGPQSR
jgi:Rrf2 family nitric oxide-sensitive transcriptional repressor